MCRINCFDVDRLLISIKKKRNIQYTTIEKNQYFFEWVKNWKIKKDQNHENLLFLEEQVDTTTFQKTNVRINILICILAQVCIHILQAPIS